MTQQQAAHLVQLHCGPRVQTLFVVIPGIGTLPPDRWSDGIGDYWLRSIRPESAPNIGIFTFENELATPKILFSCRQVESQGADFLEALYSLIQLPDLQDCPVVLFAHSLGGVILKRALCLAHWQPRFRDLLRKIARIVLLSCPHAQSEKIKAWQNIPSILKAYSKLKLKHTISREDASGLAEDCLGFEQAVDSIPVLSLFEKLETKTGGRFGQKQMLVGEAKATTQAKLERLLGVVADHDSICCLTSTSDEVEEVTSFINLATAKTRTLIEKGAKKYVRPIGLAASTVRSQESTEDLRAEIGQTNKTETSSSILSSQLQVTTPRGTAGSTTGSFQIIPTLADFTTEKTDPLLPCVVMPLSRNRHFFGRSRIMKAIDTALIDDEGENDNESGPHLRTYALCGPGGMGKTQIATEFLYRRKKNFDAVFWVNSDKPSKIAQSFSDIALSLGLVAQDSVESRDHTLTRDLVLGWLAKPLKSYKQSEKEAEEATWLLIFDNADNPEILNNYWPSDATGSVLITSRDPLAKTYVYSRGGGIALPPFDPEEATEFLLRMTDRTTEDGEYVTGATIADTLGYIPLAISQMAGVIFRRDLSFSDFLDQYNLESSRLDLFKLQLGRSKSDQEYQHTIASVWALDDLKQGAVLLEVLSLLDPDGIQEYILEDIKARSLLQGYPQSNAEYQEARTELLQSSLITRERNTKKIIIHRLIQEAARVKMADQRFDIVFGSTLALIAAVWPFEDFGFGNELYRFERCGQLYPHALWLQKLFPRYHPPTVLSATSLAAPKFLLDAAWIRIIQGNNYNEALPILEMASTLCEALPSSKKDLKAGEERYYEELETMRRLFHHHHGVIGLHTNKPKQSLDHFQSFTNMLREKFGGDKVEGGKDQSLGVAWNELGNAFLQNNLLDQAENAFEKSIDALQSMADATAISISMPLINIAFCYWLQGRLEDAATAFEKALQDREDEYGIDDTTSFVTGKLLLGFGNVRAAQGRLEESAELHKRCLMQYKSTIGNNHHRIGDACIALSNHYVRAEDYDTALALVDQAVKVYGNLDHFVPERARANFKRGKILEAKSRNADARRNFKIAEKLYTTICPEDRRSINELSDEDFNEHVMFWSR